jgi:hypothetical protein
MKKTTDQYLFDFRENWNNRVYELENEELNDFTSETMKLYEKKGQGDVYNQSLTKNGVRINNLNKGN